MPTTPPSSNLMKIKQILVLYCVCHCMQMCVSERWLVCKRDAQSCLVSGKWRKQKLQKDKKQHERKSDYNIRHKTKKKENK